MMKKEAKIYWFKDRKDYVKKLTNDTVINVLGTKGSGKTSSTLKYVNNEEYIVVNCDRLFELPENQACEDKFLSKIRNELKKKFGKIEMGQEFTECYKEILTFIKSKNKKAIIEGNALYDLASITLLKGTVIVKRTGIVKCFLRTIKRDYPNQYFLNLEIEKHGKFFGKFFRFKNIVKRRKNIFKTYHNIEKIIDEFEKLS